jgi:hypothetical protein
MFLHVLLGVVQVLEQSIVLPGDSTLLVGLGVGIALHGTGGTSDDSPQIGSLDITTLTEAHTQQKTKKKRRKEKKEKKLVS